MQIEVMVMLKEDVLDAQGRQVKNALHSLGFDDVQDCRVGKVILLDLTVDDWETAETQGRAMAEELLANTVIESFEVRRRVK